MPAVATILAHFSVSAPTKAASSSGVLVAGSMPAPIRVLVAAGSASAALNAAFSSSMTGAGVPGRPNPPNQTQT